jgi:hypothetical protein
MSPTIIKLAAQLKRNMSQIMLKFLKEVIPFIINNYKEGSSAGINRK